MNPSQEHMYNIILMKGKSYCSPQLPLSESPAGPHVKNYAGLVFVWETCGNDKPGTRFHQGRFRGTVYRGKNHTRSINLRIVVVRLPELIPQPRCVRL